MKLHADGNPKDDEQSKADIERMCDVIDEMWSKELEKGDDEYYESVMQRTNKSNDNSEPKKHKKKRGRRI